MSKKITPEIVRKVAKMSKLYQNPDEELVTKFTKQLEDILEYVEQINEVDTTNQDPLSGNRTIQIDELREDEFDLDEAKYQDIRNRIIQNFPHKQGNLLVVSNIFNS